MLKLHQHSEFEHALCPEEPIHFALLAPFTGSWIFRGAGAAPLAVERANADKSLLPGRVLKYSWKDSGGSAQQGLVAMGELLREASRIDARIDAVIGPGCSSACEVTSYLAAGQELPQISWAWLPPPSNPRIQRGTV